MPKNSNDVTTILSTTDDTTLGRDHWNIVIIECSSLASKWEQLSGFLGLSFMEIERIKVDYLKDSTGCWNEALKQWILQNYDTQMFGKPSWRSLLKSVALVDKKLFKKLAEEHPIQGESKQSTLQQLNKFEEDQEEQIRYAIERVETSSCDIEAQMASIVSTINQSFHKLHEILDLHKQALVEEAYLLQGEKLKRLVHQKEELEKRMSAIQRRVTEEKSMVEDATGESLVAVQNQVTSWMNKESSEHLNFDPVEETDTTLEIHCSTQELGRMCEKIKIVTNLVDPSKCTVEGFENMQTVHVEVNKPFAVQLRTFSMNGKPQTKPVNVDAKLKSFVDNSIVCATVEQTQGNTYNIEFTPQTRGQHQLDVTVNGLEVEGNPFHVVARISPSQLGSPLRIINGLRGPTGIAFNSVGELFVAEFNGGVAVLDKDGRKVRYIKRHGQNKMGQNYNFEHPWGVAVDADDNIYVTDQDNRKIYKFNEHLELVTHNIMRQNKCFGVAIIGERVIVIEKKSKNLEIFTRDLQFLKVIEIGIEGCSLACDGHSRLYICDALTHRIKVLSDQGEHLYSIGDKPGLGLQIPHFVCIDGDLLYVTEYEGHCVSVFTKDQEGTYVTSFGRMGSGEGQFDHPYGIAQDANGFLYVSDRVNNRLQVF